MFLTHSRFFAVAAAVLFGASRVLADAIDGNWCNGIKRLEISSMNFVTQVETVSTASTGAINLIIPHPVQNGCRGPASIWS